MDVIVIGGGWCGLATALLLERDGHAVTVLEADDCGGRSADAWETWERPGVAQFRHPHLLMPRGRSILDEELPEVSAALLANGAGDFSFLDIVPHIFPPDVRVPADERFRTYTVRRPVLESALREVAQSRVEVRGHAKVAGLTVGPTLGDGVPTVTGVSLRSGEDLDADLVIDATGRRARGDEWLPAIGVRPPDLHAESDGFTYYSRFFRSADGSTPQFRGPMTIPYGSISVLTLPGDNGTWSVTIFVQSRDQQAKAVRHEDAWMRVMRSCAAQAHWLDGEPFTGMLAISGVLDQRRDLTDDRGLPTVHGYVTVGDAWSSTNPSLGRGLAMALMQAQRLRDVVRAARDEQELAREWSRVLDHEFVPWYETAVATDHDRIAEVDAIAHGEPVPPATDPTARLRLAASASGDRELFRAMFDVAGLHALPDEVMGRPDVARKLDELGPISVTGSPFAGPDRAKLLELVAG